MIWEELIVIKLYPMQEKMLEAMTIDIKKNAAEITDRAVRLFDIGCISRQGLIDMVDSSPRHLHYQSIVEQMASVQSDLAQDLILDHVSEGEEVLVPTFEIISNPTVRLSEIRARRFHIIDPNFLPIGELESNYEREYECEFLEHDDPIETRFEILDL